MFKRFVILAWRIIIGLCVLNVLVDLFLVTYSGWHPHQSNILDGAWDSFLHFLGTSSAGFITPIILSAVTIVLSVLVIRQLQGKQVMKDQWWSNTVTTAVVTVTVLLTIYGPIFSWHVVNTIYVRHVGLVQDNANLASQIKKQDEVHCFMTNIKLPAPRDLPTVKSARSNHVLQSGKKSTVVCSR